MVAAPIAKVNHQAPWIEVVMAARAVVLVRTKEQQQALVDLLCLRLRATAAALRLAVLLTVAAVVVLALLVEMVPQTSEATAVQVWHQLSPVHR